MRHILRSCLLGAAILNPATLIAQETSDANSEFPTPESTAFSIKGNEFSFEYLMQFAAILVSNPETIDVESAYPLLAELAIEQELAAQAAINLGIDETRELQQTLQLVRSSLLAEAYMNQQVSARLTQERLDAAYALYVEEFVPGKLATASHILLETPEEAIAAIVRLNAGEDFAALAQELSIGPSGPSGGALGSFGPGQMVEPFEAAAFALTPGNFSQEPVQTQFGFHVVYLQDLIDSAPESFASIEPTLQEQVSLDIQNEIREELRSSGSYDITAFEDLPKIEF